MATPTTIASSHETHHTWAQRLAARQRTAASARHEDAQVRVVVAVEALWELFDTAYREAASALEALGEPGRISVVGEAARRVYRATDPNGRARLITVYAQLTTVKGEFGGGAYINIGRSRLSIFLTPTFDRGRVRWQVARTGRPFTSALVHDLFLSEFGDDPEATLRLSPLSGKDLFQDMWG